ncbi:MAG: hypothetical protein ACI9NY_000359 [Kiritimatiellia bacterium]|jgi:hypothetical protein
MLTYYCTLRFLRLARLVFSDFISKFFFVESSNTALCCDYEMLTYYCTLRFLRLARLVFSDFISKFFFVESSNTALRCDYEMLTYYCTLRFLRLARLVFSDFISKFFFVESSNTALRYGSEMLRTIVRSAPFPSRASISNILLRKLSSNVLIFLSVDQKVILQLKLGFSTEY